jgi:uncharacterized membrane protein YphA (DoxX/SURF4 family)
MDFIYQYSGWGMIALRIALAVVFVVHGWAKIKNPAGVAQALGWPKNAGLLLGLIEFAAALAVLSGVLIEYGAIAMALVMVGAIYTKVTKWKLPFWSQTNTGWEFDLVLFAGALAVLLG